MNIKNRTIFVGKNCDNLHVMRGIDSASIDLIATDPPFNSKRSFNAPLGSRAAGQKFDDRWVWDGITDVWYKRYAKNHPPVKEVIEAAAVIEGGEVDYERRQILTGRTNSMAAFLCWMAPRLIDMKRILKPSGSLYLHCDDSANSYLRLLLDAVFGRNAFRNEISWKRTGGRTGSNRWGRVTDTIFYYAGPGATWNDQFEPHRAEYIENAYRNEDQHGRWQSDQLTASGQSRGDSGKPWRGIDPNDRGNHWRAPEAFPSHVPMPDDWGDLSVREKLDQLDALGLVHWPEKGVMPRFKRYLSTSRGRKINDFWPNAPSTKGEWTGWVTQKPVSLYERIIRASSNEGDIVFDPFAGCSTTIIAAERLNRQWVGCDIDSMAETILAERMDQWLNEQAMETGRGRRPVEVRKSPPRREDMPPMPKQEMKEVLYRKQEAQCANPYCSSRGLRIVDFHIDHELPKSRGGPDDLWNRMLLCGNCNTRKSDSSWDDFLNEEQKRQPHPPRRGKRG